MQINKKGNLFMSDQRTQQPDYEYANKFRNSSPVEANMYYVRRSPIRGRGQSNDSGAGEMVYIEPNETNFKRIEDTSPLNNYIIRSPGENIEERGYTRTDYERGGAIDFSGHIPQHVSRIPQFNTDMEQNRERKTRSPNTINIADSRQDNDYNIKTLKWNKSPKFSYVNSPPENPLVERSYNAGGGNIFLDQPMQQTSFVRHSDYRTQDLGQNSREIVFAMNPRDLQEPSPGVLQRMSPQGNVEGDSDSNSEKNDNQIKDLKTQLDKRANVIMKQDDGMMDRVLPNELEKIEDFVRPREMQEMISGEEVKKLVKQYVKAYDPKRREDGNLISNSQMIVSSSTHDVFNDRYKVLQKMNKLSTILLSKRNTTNEGSPLNKSYGDRTFDRNTLNNTLIGGKRTLGKRQNKFLYVSLAMLSSKGLNTEDRIILRRMRMDKGGVVDLAQEQVSKKDKFKIKKVKAAGRGHAMINPKYREKAAKIVQAWWRERKQKYNKILDQIIKIQSVWRGKFIRKFVYDIIYVSYLNQKFLDIMSRTLVNHIRPQVWDELFSRKKLIKSILGDLLERKDERFTTLRIRPYFIRWYTISNFLKKRIEKSGRLVINKGNKDQVNKILKQYLYQWALRTNLEKYIGKAQDAEEKKQKFFGALNLINGLNSFTKRNVYRNTHEPITSYLKDLLKNKLLKKITDKENMKLSLLLLKKYFNRWKDVANKEKFRDFKGGVFNNNVTHVDNRMDKIKLKYYFDKWRKQIPSAKKIFEINDGVQILNRFILRNTFQYPLNAFNENLYYEKMREAALKTLIIKQRNLKDNLRDYFNRWKLETILRNEKDYRNEILATLIKNIANNNLKRILYKKFCQWRQRPKIDINEEMSKYNYLMKVLSDFYQNQLRPDKKYFMDLLNKTISDRAKNIAARKVFKNYYKQSQNLLRYYFYMWKNQIIKGEIEDLHQQLLRFLINNRENINNRNKLAKYLTRWRLFSSDEKNYDNMNKLNNVNKGLDIISNIYNRRGRDLIIRLYRLMGNDYRPLILSKIINEINKPRGTLREYFDRWKNIINDEINKEKINNIKGRFFNIGIKNVNQRSNRDLLMKAFFKWKIMCKKPEEYYPMVSKFLELLKNKIRKDTCDEPFKRILFTKNLTRPLQKIINTYNNQEKKLLNDKLINLLGRWRKIASDYNIKDLKAELIFKLKKNLENNERIKTLAKYFIRWKLFRKKEIGINFNKGMNILTNLLRKMNADLVFDIFKAKVNSVSKDKGLEDMIRFNDKILKKIARNALNTFYRKAMNTDPNRMKKIKTRLRRFIKHNEEEPRAKAFFKWRRIVDLLKARDNDIYQAQRIIAIELRKNDRKNLISALSKWRSIAYILRDRYLKGLLMKQIKSSQGIKEQMNNEAKLRAAFLKWRFNLIPIDYLDRLKQIRKGCKLFKLALRKLHEEDILNNIKDLANYNKKIDLLSDIILSVRPKLANYHLKRCLDIWKSKLGDTQRMKNKLHLLLEDYIYSDKVHDGLFKQPQDDIINLLKNYYDLKNEKANKIKYFINMIIEAKKNKEKLYALIKLLNIIFRKQKALKETKKLYFIRFYRQIQNIINDENSKIIQKFIKEKLRSYFDKRELIKKGIDLLGIFLKKYCINRINDKARDNLMDTVLINGIQRQDNTNKKILRNALNIWKNKIPLLIQNEAAIKITDLFRIIKAKNNLNNLRKRIILLKSINNNYDTKNKNNLDLRFQNWLNRAKMLNNNENATIIQNFCKNTIKKFNENKSKNELKNLFRRNIKHLLANIMQKSSRIIGGKGEVLYKMLEDILYRIPYDKFMNNLAYYGKLNTLQKVQPKIHDALKKYFLPLALRKWKANTYDISVKNAIIMQKFLREQYKRRLKRNHERRELLLKEILNRLILNNMYKLQLPFTIWNKKAKLINFNEKVSKIQNAFRNYLARKKRDDLQTQSKWDKFIRLVLYKNILNSLIDAGNDKNIKINRKLLLINILKRKLYVDDKSALKRYFDKWRQYNIHVNKCAQMIQNAYRIMKANKLKNKLKKINELLLKAILRHEKKDNDKKRCKLRKWDNIVKLLKCDNDARIIQNFIIPQLARLLNSKFKQFFYDNAHKKINRLILLLAKMNKLNHAYNRPIYQRFIDNLKLNNRMNKIGEHLTNLVNNKDENNMILLLKKYLLKWRDIAYNIKDKEYNAAAAIQRAFLCYKAIKEKNRLMKIKNILNLLVNKKSNISNNKLYYYFTKWNSIVKAINVNENAEIIQKFCRTIQDKLQKQKDFAKDQKIKNGLDKLLKIKFGKKYAYDKILSERNRNIFSEFNNNLQNHRLNTLKDCFDLIRQKAFYNKLRKAIKVPDTFKLRLLKKNINIWRDNANKLARLRAAELIQRNVRLFLLSLRYENKSKLLSDILCKLINKYSDYKEKYLHKWKDIAENITLIICKRRVAKYIANRYKISDARKNWINLSRLLALKNRNNDIFNLVRRIENFIKLNKFMKHFSKICRKQVISKLIVEKNKENIHDILVDVLPKINNINKEIILRYYINKWQDKVNNIIIRENKLLEAMAEIDKRKILTDVENMNNAMLVKKIFHDIPYAGAKIFIDKLKDNLYNKNKYIKLKDDIINTYEDEQNKNKMNLMNKLYKIFTYKKIDNMVNVLNSCLKDKIKPIFTKDLIQKLYINKTKCLDYNYSNNKSHESKSNIINFTFKKHKKEKPTMIIDNQALIKKSLPSFIKYLNNKILIRKEETFKNINKKYRENKFIALFKKFNDKTLLSPKTDIVHLLKRETEFSKTRPLYQVKLFKIFRRKYIKEITTKLIEPSRLYNLFYLINITEMHKQIKQQRYFRELIRKWRFIVFTKKMARKKLELMYKNMHASYLQMADQIFGEDDVNPSVFKEFEMFGNNVGMFTGQEPEIDEEISKKYAYIDKKYSFIGRGRASTIDETKRGKKIRQEKTEELEEEEIINREELIGPNGRPLNQELSKSSKIFK